MGNYILVKGVPLFSASSLGNEIVWRQGARFFGALLVSALFLFI